MKAYVRSDNHTRNIKLAETSIPAIDENEVLIEVKAFGVGLHDRFFIPKKVSFPYTVGSEGAGVIMDIGKKVTHYKKGDRVVFTSSLLPKGGSWAEYIAIPNTNLVQLPDCLSFVEGASLPVAGMTALNAMNDLYLNYEDTLFIAGASGAVGTFVIQLARKKGIIVICSASEKNQEYMTSLGGCLSINYKSLSWKQDVLDFVLEGADAALAIQPNTGKDSMDVVKDNGKVILVSGGSLIFERGIAVKQLSHRLDSQQAMTGLISNIADGSIDVVIDHIYPFDQAVEALEKTELRHARGKVVVEVN